MDAHHRRGSQGGRGGGLIGGGETRQGHGEFDADAVGEARQSPDPGRSGPQDHVSVTVEPQTSPNKLGYTNLELWWPELEC